MRFVAFLALLMSLAAAGWAGQALWLELQTRVDPPPIRPVMDAQAEPQPPAEASPPRQWSAFFGERQPPKPPEPPKAAEDEPQPPPKKFPPLASKGYVLKGMVQANGVAWALVSHPTGERVLRVGDALEEGLIIARIGDDGLWAKPEGDAEMQLAWPE